MTNVWSVHVLLYLFVRLFSCISCLYILSADVMRWIKDVYSSSTKVSMNRRDLVRYSRVAGRQYAGVGTINDPAVDWFNAGRSQVRLSPGLSRNSWITQVNRRRLLKQALRGIARCCNCCYFQRRQHSSLVLPVSVCPCTLCWPFRCQNMKPTATSYITSVCRSSWSPAACQLLRQFCTSLIPGLTHDLTYTIAMYRPIWTSAWECWWLF